jgi:hypothetical protein
MEAKHIKLPWMVNNFDQVFDATGNIIADCKWTNHTPEHRMANAAFIVRACNSHEELLGACEKVLDIINSYSHIPAQFKACEILQAAIAKAKGE